MNKDGYESLIEQDVDKFVGALMPNGGGATITEQRLRLHLKALVAQIASHTRSYELMNLCDSDQLAEMWNVSKRRVQAHVSTLNERWGVGRKVGGTWLLSIDEAERYRPQSAGRPKKQK